MFSKFHSLCSKEFPVRESSTPSHVNPIHATTAFVFDNAEHGMEAFQGQSEGFIYSRWDNPSINAVEQKLAELESLGITDPDGKELSLKARLYSSGMGALSSLMTATLQSGDKIITQGDLYGGTNELFVSELKRQGIQTIITDLSDLEKVEKYLQENDDIRMVYIETPANPTMRCYDIGALSNMAKRANAWTVVDNTLCTPLLQQPFQFGADFVMHSATKFLNGHGNSVAGAIIGKDHDMMDGPVYKTSKLMGANSNAFDAFLLSTGLKTLALRMEKHCKNAREVADALKDHYVIDRLWYTGLPDHTDAELINRQMNEAGGMLSFEVKGGFDKAVAFLNNLRFCTIAVSLGTVDTIIQHPASMTHVGVDRATREQYGISDGLIRLSVGIEEADDIIDDLTTALEKALA
jgi:methionine-gamma-lyase